MDLQGRYTFLEMREMVRRRCDGYRRTVDITTGDESGTQQVDPLFTTEDIKMYLNQALVKRHIDLTTLDETIMADSSTIDLVVDQVEYELPEDLLFLRAIYYKPPGVEFTEIPPNQRMYLYEYEQENEINMADLGAPTYRRRLNTIVLNNVPKSANVGGLVVDYVKGALPLLADDQVLETAMATIMQHVIILDAAIYITTEKMKIEASELRQSLTDLEARYELAVINYHMPKVVRMMPMRTMVYPPGMSRGSRLWQSRGGFRWW